MRLSPSYRGVGVQRRQHAIERLEVLLEKQMAHSILFVERDGHLGPRPSQGARLIVKRCHGQSGKEYASVYVRSLVGTKPIATYTNVQQIHVGLTDHPLVIQIGNPILVKPPVIASFSPDSNVVGDGITNAHHITLTGTGVANSTVKVFDGAT